MGGTQTAALLKFLIETAKVASFLTQRQGLLKSALKTASLSGVDLVLPTCQWSVVCEPSIQFCCVLAEHYVEQFVCVALCIHTKVSKCNGPFLTATAAQEAHLSVCTSVRPYVCT